MNTVDITEKISLDHGSGEWVPRKALLSRYCENGTVSLIMDPHCSLQTGQLRDACEWYLGVQGWFTQEMNAQASCGELYSRLSLTITSPGPWGFSASIVLCYQSNGEGQG